MFVNVLSYYQTAGFRKKPPLHLEQYLRFVILLRYKYLYLRFLRFPPCGILWICPHFDQNILISYHLSFYPINWFHDKSANHISTDLSENAIERIGKCPQIRIVSMVSLEIKNPSFAAMILADPEIEPIGTKTETEPARTKSEIEDKAELLRDWSLASRTWAMRSPETLEIEIHRSLYHLTFSCRPTVFFFFRGGGGIFPATDESIFSGLTCKRWKHEEESR